MKRLYSSLLILAVTLIACQNAPTEVATEKLAKVEMKVDGMVCAMGCAKFIEDKVAEKEGVTESKVDFENKTAYFTYNENAISAEDLEKFIDEIHDGQYDATISGAEENSTVNDDQDNSMEEDLDEENEEEDESVVQVVNKIQNISFPQLLTYFMKRL